MITRFGKKSVNLLGKFGYLTFSCVDSGPLVTSLISPSNTRFTLVLRKNGTVINHDIDITHISGTDRYFIVIEIYGTYGYLQSIHYFIRN